MVAVPRSNGCLTCRSRRIKVSRTFHKLTVSKIAKNRQCDEGVPVCKRCRDSRRDCAYRNKFTFVDGGSKRRSPDADSGGVERNGSRSMHNSVWLYTTERRTDSGSLFQKWHRSDALPALASEPAMTEKERQASKLIKCFHEGRAGARLDQLGKWLLLVPQRLGVSQALDDAAVLLSSVHSAMLRRPDLDSSMWVDTAPYLQAVTSLREAVADPIKGFSVETLAATFTLYYIEVSLISDKRTMPMLSLT